MNEFITFLKDIFMIKEAAPMSVGLSQFKAPKTEPEPKPKEKKEPKNKEIKLSDLMRRS